MGILFIVVLLICFLSLGIKDPLKWFRQTRMKNMQKEEEDSQKGVELK
jgi:hypothetical protein